MLGSSSLHQLTPISVGFHISLLYSTGTRYTWVHRMFDQCIPFPSRPAMLHNSILIHTHPPPEQVTFCVRLLALLATLSARRRLTARARRCLLERKAATTEQLEVVPSSANGWHCVRASASFSHGRRRQAGQRPRPRPLSHEALSKARTDGRRVLSLNCGCMQ